MNGKKFTANKYKNWIA